MEELVAELGAAFVCADLELTPEVRPNHASYIDNWLTVLRTDKRVIFSAASHAQRALQSNRTRGPACEELYSTEHSNVADGLAGLPRDGVSGHR